MKGKAGRVEPSNKIEEAKVSNTRTKLHEAINAADEVNSSLASFITLAVSLVNEKGEIEEEERCLRASQYRDYIFIAVRTAKPDAPCCGTRLPTTATTSLCSRTHWTVQIHDRK